MKKVKKNNKGFSLVELIVVVLIMAIIAVALAPQVMKWVNNSRLATDVSNYDSLVANCQLALADAKAYKAVTEATSDIVITYSDTASSTLSTPTDFVNAMNSLDPNWNQLKAKVSGESYTVTITKGTGAIVRTDAPDTSANSDLK